MGFPFKNDPRQGSKDARQRGGTQIINDETKDVFAKFGSNEFKFLNSQDLSTFPAIAHLGNSVSINPSAFEIPANIRIRFGSHYDTKFIVVFDPSKSFVSKNLNESNLIQVSSNIFFTE